MTTSALHSTRVITPKGLVEATLILGDGKIMDVLPGRVERAGIPFESVGDKVIMPGVIDAHVHINEPGRTEWEGFETATKAAAASRGPRDRVALVIGDRDDRVVERRLDVGHSIRHVLTFATTGTATTGLGFRHGKFLTRVLWVYSRSNLRPDVATHGYTLGPDVASWSPSKTTATR